MRVYAEAVVNDERGIHARPSAMIVKAARAHSGAVTVRRAAEADGPEYDCKDMLALVELAAVYGERVRFCVETPLDLPPARLEEGEQQATAVCRRLVEIVSMTLQEIERLSVSGM